MDQTKTGRFIALMRKEKNLTQKQLADKLNISDKTVSKWETGKGLPEVSLMMPLCEILGISVNEMLSGERLNEKNYKERTQEIIMDLIKEKEESKKKIILAVIVCFITLLASITLIVLSGLLQMEIWMRILLIAIGFIVMLGGIGVAAALEMSSGTFECRYCKARFVPTAGAYIAGAHTITTRHLKCPQCGKKSWCKRKLTH